MSINSLSDQVISHIITYLEFIEIVKHARLSKRFNRILTSNPEWVKELWPKRPTLTACDVFRKVVLAFSDQTWDGSLYINYLLFPGSLEDRSKVEQIVKRMLICRHGFNSRSYNPFDFSRPAIREWGFCTEHRDPYLKVWVDRYEGEKLVRDQNYAKTADDLEKIVTRYHPDKAS